MGYMTSTGAYIYDVYKHDGVSGNDALKLYLFHIKSGVTFNLRDAARWKQNEDGSWVQGEGDGFIYQRAWQDRNDNGIEDGADRFDYFTGFVRLHISGGHGNDFIDGSHGNDIIHGWGGDDVIYGRNGNDSIETQGGTNVIYGGGGHDEISVWGGHNRVYGGDGDDYFVGGGGGGTVYFVGGRGDDFASSQGGTDAVLLGGSGNDRLYSGPFVSDDDPLIAFFAAGTNRLDGGSGNDVITGGRGEHDTMVADYSKRRTDEDLTIDVTQQLFWRFSQRKEEDGDNPNYWWRYDHDDWSLSNSDFDIKYQRLWIDLNGNGIEDASDEYDYFRGIEKFELIGNSGNDRIVAGAGDDILEGRAGSDVLIGNDGDDVLRGQSGKDNLFGGDGDDILHGGRARDVLKGQAGDDELYGGLGRDTLVGGAGDDSLHGGSGKDLLIGGTGRDTFHLQKASLRYADIIEDYEAGDRLDFGGKKTVYTKQVGDNTLVLSSHGDDAKYYAIIEGYTGPLAQDDINFVEIV